MAVHLHAQMSKVKQKIRLATVPQACRTERKLSVVANSKVLFEVRESGNLRFGLPAGRVGNNNPEYRRNLMLHAATKVDGAEVQPAPPAEDLAAAELVHSAGFVQFLQSAYRRWMTELSQDSSYILQSSRPDAEVALVPFHCIKSHEPRAAGLSAEFACYASDFETPIFQSTASVLKDDIGVIVDSADRIARGERSVYALTTNAGHHAGPSYFSGFCYINNASIACSLLEKAGRHPALFDLDFHAGNGSFDIAQTNAMWFRSVNCAGAYPWVDMGASGIELPPGTTWSGGYARALESVLAELPEHIDTIVISLGYDTLETDPEAGKRAGVGLSLQTTDFNHMASMLADAGRPVLVVQEGGYDLDNIPAAFSGFVRGLI